MNPPKRPQTPQKEEKYLPRSSPSAAHSHSGTQKPTTINGVFFAAASNLEFSEQTEFNAIDGDLHVDRDVTETIGDENPPSSHSSRPGPNQHWAPGTIIDGTFFPGASGIHFAGKQQFNHVGGTMVKKYRSGHSNDAQDTQTIDPSSQKDDRKRNPSSSSSSSSQSPPRAHPSQGTQLHIKGEFFAAAHNAKFTGTTEFNAVAQNVYMTYRNDISTEAKREQAYQTESELR
ncbi:hypothetical protein DFH05DRAFT_1488827 [Lentinula detonsa]|uniref:Uncharacterized protein n=1 Tax=Lentinula detonsa TaxID=2804962 RepID=A0A9W8P2V7_9AGAR|nr:hypothetical protein DFH05DRAFT_1488827 [Lentinula detonsa]